MDPAEKPDAPIGQGSETASQIPAVGDPDVYASLEGALRESQDRFKHTFDQAGIGRAMVTAEGLFTRVNQAFCDMLQYTETELQQMSWRHITHPEDLQEASRLVGELVQGKIPSFYYIHRLLRKDGQTIWVKLNIVLARDQNGAPRYGICDIVDIDNFKQAEEELQKYSTRMEALLEAGIELSSHLVLGNVLERILVQLEKVLPFDAGTFHIVEDENTRIVGIHNVPESMMGLVFPLTEYVFNRNLVRSSEPILIEDIRVDSHGFALHEEVRHMRCIVGVPLRAGQRTVGILILKHRQPGGFSQADAKVAQAFGQQAAVAIENANLYQQAQHEIAERKRAEEVAQRHLQEVTLLNQIALAITSGDDSEKALQRVCTQLAEFVDVPQTGFAVMNPQRTATTVIAEHSPTGIPTSIGAQIPVTGNPSSGYVLEHKQPLQIRDAQTDPLMEAVHGLMKQRNVHSILITPVIVDGEVIGTLGFDSFELRDFDPDQVEIVQHVANQAGQLWLRKRAQEALVDSEERHRTLFETMAEGVVYRDAQGVVINANPAAEEILGLTLDQMLERPRHDPYWDTIYEDGSELPREENPSMRALKSGEEVRNVVMGVYNPQTDSHRWLSVNAIPLFRRGEEKPFQVYTTFSDITARREFIAELEMRFRQQAALTFLGEKALADSDLTGLCDQAVSIVAETLGVEYCKVLELLPGGEEMLLVSGVGWQEGLVGQGCVDTGPDLQAGYTLVSDAPVVVDDLRTETRFSGPELLKQHQVVSGMSVIIPGTGAPYGVLGAHSTRRIGFTRHDINFMHSIANVLAEAIQRKRIEDTLRESEERFELATSAAQIGVWEHDLESGYFYYDPRLKAMLGYEDHEMENTREGWQAHLHPEDAGEVLSQTDAYIEDHSKQYAFEFRMLHKDGSIRWFQTLGTGVRDENGRIVRLIGLDLNITERKLLEDALHASQKMADIGVVAAGIAHEINTPLQVITGLSGRIIRQVQSDRLDRERLPVDMETLDRNAWRVARIVRSLLTYARTSLDEVGEHDLSEIVTDTLVLIEHQLKTWSNIDVVQQLTEGMPLLHCDRGSITQVLINLLTNARDAMPSGGEIKIRTAYESSQDRFVLQVNDNGMGISEEQRKKIFDPFFTTKMVGEGTGMGLPIVLSIVQAHGGEIQVDSRPGEGTTFTIYLPESPPENMDEEGEEFDAGRYLL